MGGSFEPSASATGFTTYMYEQSRHFMGKRENTDKNMFYKCTFVSHKRKTDVQISLRMRYVYNITSYM